MQSIIKELYYGNIRPFERRFNRNSDYAKALYTAGDCEKRLTELLGVEELRLYEELSKANRDVTTEEEADAFIVGFRLGAGFVFDTFIGKESILKPVSDV